MKRSEAVEKLALFLEVELNVCEEIAMEKAKGLITTLIDMGMSPPKIATYNANNQFWNYSNEWEQE